MSNQTRQARKNGSASSARKQAPASSTEKLDPLAAKSRAHALAMRGAFSLQLSEAIEAFLVLVQTAPTNLIAVETERVASELDAARRAGADPNLAARDFYRWEAVVGFASESGVTGREPAPAASNSAGAAPDRDPLITLPDGTAEPADHPTPDQLRERLMAQVRANRDRMSRHGVQFKYPLTEARNNLLFSSWDELSQVLDRAECLLESMELKLRNLLEDCCEERVDKVVSGFFRLSLDVRNAMEKHMEDLRSAIRMQDEVFRLELTQPRAVEDKEAVA